MRIKFNIFQKMLVLLLILLTPVVALYYYSTSKSINVIQEELIKASLNRMELFVAQLDASIEKFDLVSAPMLVDTNVLEYLYNLNMSDYSLMKTRLLIQEKLSLASASGNWRNDVTVYFPQRDDSISSSPSYEYDLKEFESRFSLGGATAKIWRLAPVLLELMSLRVTNQPVRTIWMLPFALTSTSGASKICLIPTNLVTLTTRFFTKKDMPSSPAGPQMGPRWTKLSRN